jgi:hypothetical protein
MKELQVGDRPISMECGRKVSHGIMNPDERGAQFEQALS